MSKRTLPVEKKTADSVVKVLDPILVDLIELRAHVKHAHWNLRDAAFIAIHRLLDEVAGIIDEGTDEIAERVRQLGQPVGLPTSRVAKQTTLSPFPTGELSGNVCIGAVCERLNAVIGKLREGIAATSDKVDEPITADLLTGFCGKLEVQLWLLDSHLS